MLIRSCPYRDALAACGIFAGDAHLVLLDGAAAHDGNGRYSYLAADPYRVIGATPNGVTIDGRSDACNIFTALDAELKQFAGHSDAVPVPFTGGAVGFLGYALGGCLERLPAPREDGLSLPLGLFAFYDVVAAFDHRERKGWILSSGQPETESSAKEARARMRADAIEHKLAHAPACAPEPDWSLRSGWQAELSRRDVEERVEKIIAYIRAGDIFQANFTQRFKGRLPRGLSDLDLYRRLRALSPAPFAAFMRAGPGLSVLGASPERFLSLRPDGFMTAQPIKGTRPRAADPARDAAFAQELERSAKDHAENLMIVDLMRNDLSRVAQLGSVHVPHLCALETFASVHHLTSTVTGRLKPGLGAVDLLRASFPGGSVTGTPKIRAMEIIHELEPAPRGVYCGCLGWIGLDGAMDMSMTIRTLTVAGDTVLAQAGGGIVADSDPAAEYEESMIKIAPLLQALTGEGR